jgi:hypothetical protein
MQAKSTGVIAYSKRFLGTAIGFALVGAGAGVMVYGAGLISHVTGYTPNTVLAGLIAVLCLFVGWTLWLIGIDAKKAEAVRAKEDAYWDEQGGWAYHHYLQCNSEDPPIEVLMDRNAAREREAKKQAVYIQELRDIPWHEDI